MTFKVQVGPHQISIHQGQTVLVSEPDGQIRWPSDMGLYFLDTRVISSWAIYANGEPGTCLMGAPLPTTRHAFISPTEGFPPWTASSRSARSALFSADRSAAACTMKALRFRKFGPPSVPAIEEVPRPNPRDGEALIQVKAAAINPSDVFGEM